MKDTFINKFGRSSVFLFIMFLAFIIACSNSEQERNSSQIMPYNVSCQLTIDTLKELFLQKPLAVMKSNCYQVTDTLLVSDDDELITWPGKAFFTNTGQLAFLVESNWADTIHIHRITVYDRDLKTKDICHTGISFSKLRPFVLPTITNYPDGYLFVQSKKDSSILYELDISHVSKESPLFYGVNSITQIPDSLKVRTIILQ
ncbi:hypothetical protein QNI16_21995 [Cytophagaceae bacterium YF14B1]|uniref:Lipoprotein n=1 Tax=Xanthocytophaga flava TaxID=3048013 RepID=A0AAE3QQT9_9BACT|nr:hypothetical protein [Xanthocytophaga flavus]MDJ1483186.1 hypothetical protein [Xanthocytophaga flavus]